MQTKTITLSDLEFLALGLLAANEAARRDHAGDSPVMVASLDVLANKMADLAECTRGGKLEFMLAKPDAVNVVDVGEAGDTVKTPTMLGQPGTEKLVD